MVKKPKENEQTFEKSGHKTPVCFITMIFIQELEVLFVGFPAFTFVDFDGSDISAPFTGTEFTFVFSRRIIMFI